ncbi:hypothetical protein Ancab_003876 [Ancistrocladus abbreviatus]
MSDRSATITNSNFRTSLPSTSPPPNTPGASLSLSVMEKRLRSSLQTSAESFLSAATKLSLKSSKPSLKTLIHSIATSSELSTSLPLCLRSAISKSISSFSTSENPANPRTPPSPPTKRLRRSSRNTKNQNQSTPDTKESERKCILENLKIYAFVALVCTTHPKRVFSPEDLLPAVRELHDNLILFESDSALLSEISNLCEEWWKEGLAGREMLISQFVPFLVARSLTLEKKVDVHRVYVLREAFGLFDFEDESIEDLKLLLIRCMITSLYLKMEDGRRFIAFTFGLSPQLLKEALAMIISQIPFGRKQMLEAYGDIVFRGWKNLEGNFRREIEDGFLQRLIEGAIHAKSPSFAASIRRVLGGFVDQRTSDGVEKLLFRLAEPVIFRSLQVANSNVRQNALYLLLDFFPLEDPDATKEVKDTLLDKQFFLLERLLMDDCPDIRVVAVEGSCRVLHLFWEIIPSSTITKILSKVFDDMPYDLSNEVRLSTLNGIIYLLGNPHSHEILKVLLPRLGHVILDSALSVRLAIADLLLHIRDIRGFQFNKVVDFDVLLTTLANDQSPVAQKITRLLIPSYFPSKVGLAEACNRFVTLIKRSPAAGARFCEFAMSEGASRRSLLELVRVLLDVALSPDNLNADQIDGILAAAAHLCNNLTSETSYVDALKKLLSGEKLKGLLAVSSSGRAKSSSFNIASAVSPAGVAGILEECLGLITNCSDLSGNSERQAEVRSVHKLIMSCNWFDDMFEALTRVLQSTAHICHTKFRIEMPRQVLPSAKRKKRLVKLSARWNCGKRPSTFKYDYQIAVGVAWQLKDLLNSEACCKAILASEALDLAFIALKVISEVSISHCMCCDFMDASPIAAYTTLSLHIALQNIAADDIESNTKRKNVSPSSIESSSEITSLDQTIDHVLHFTEKVLLAGVWVKPGSQSLECNQCNNLATHCRKGKQMESFTEASTADVDGSVFTYGKRMSNMVKILTAVLKFIVDAAILGLVSCHQKRCLQFTSTYVHNVISCLRQCSHDELQFQEAQLREIYICLKSCFSYAAKLLNVVLSCVSEDMRALREVYNLANFLLDLIISFESYWGSGYAASLITVAKQWLPDLILALGSGCLLKHSAEDITSLYELDGNKIHFPSWFSVLAKLEICELRSEISEEEADGSAEQKAFPAFKKLIRMMIPLLQVNLDVLDVVGVMFLTGAMTGLQRKDHGLLLGLIRFICVKLIRQEDRDLGKLNMILTSTQKLYQEIEREVEKSMNGEVGLRELLVAKALLEPIWLYACETRGLT